MRARKTGDSGGFSTVTENTRLIDSDNARITFLSNEVPL
jgi:hypothetical protein